VTNCGKSHADLWSSCGPGRPDAKQAKARVDSGATLRKAMIALPLLALAICAIVVPGLYFAVDHHVERLTAVAARATAAALTPAERQQIALKTIDDSIKAYPLLQRDRLSVKVTTEPDDPDRYDVTLTYDAAPTGIWSLDRMLPLPSSTIRHSSTMRHGNP
jgi:Flp pilus assembly protein TadG